MTANPVERRLSIDILIKNIKIDSVLQNLQRGEQILAASFA